MQIAELFQNEQVQTLQLPEEFHFPGDKVLIKRMGNAVVLQPFDDP